MSYFGGGVGTGCHAQTHDAPLPGLEKLPKHVDWRKKGFVTPVYDQGECNSYYAFSATGAVEGQHFARTKKLVKLSEQNLVDCSRDEGNLGCSGGIMNWAFDYITKNGGIDTEKCYPYKALWAFQIAISEDHCRVVFLSLAIKVDTTGGKGWGTDRGMKGYIWMSRNKGNQCGIATNDSYPLIDTSS